MFGEPGFPVADHSGQRAGLRPSHPFELLLSCPWSNARVRQLAHCPPSRRDTRADPTDVCSRTAGDDLRSFRGMTPLTCGFVRPLPSLRTSGVEESAAVVNFLTRQQSRRRYHSGECQNEANLSLMAIGLSMQKRVAGGKMSGGQDDDLS